MRYIGDKLAANLVGLLQLRDVMKENDGAAVTARRIANGRSAQRHLPRPLTIARRDIQFGPPRFARLQSLIDQTINHRIADDVKNRSAQIRFGRREQVFETRIDEPDLTPLVHDQEAVIEGFEDRVCSRGAFCRSTF